MFGGVLVLTLLYGTRDTRSDGGREKNIEYIKDEMLQKHGRIEADG